MIRACLILWRRAPFWRAALLLALPTTSLAVFGPVAPHRPPREAALPTPDTEASVDAAPAFPLPPPPPKHMTAAERGADWNESAAPFYAVPPWQTGWSEREKHLADEEADRPVHFTGTATVRGDDVPLPPGVWTAVAVTPDPIDGDPAAGGGVLLARLDGHDATGFILIRGHRAPGPRVHAAIPPANPMCTYPRRYARAVIRPPGPEGEACWYIAEATWPDLSWGMVLDPPELGVGRLVMHRLGDGFPVVLVGATYFRSTATSWREVTYFFDPLANDVREGGPAGGWSPVTAASDPTMAAFLAKLTGWFRALLPFLSGKATPPSAAALARINEAAPT